MESSSVGMSKEHWMYLQLLLIFAPHLCVPYVPSMHPISVPHFCAPFLPSIFTMILYRDSISFVLDEGKRWISLQWSQLWAMDEAGNHTSVLILFNNFYKINFSTLYKVYFGSCLGLVSYEIFIPILRFHRSIVASPPLKYDLNVTYFLIYARGSTKGNKACFR